MKKKIIAFILALFVIKTPLYAFAQPAEAVSNNYGYSVDAKAAIVMEAFTGKVLFAQNEHEKLPIASTTKIMTALLALEQEDVQKKFKVNPSAIKVEGTSMGLKEGDEVTLEVLAIGMLLASGNDGANAAAVRISGSIPAFAKLMNEKAREIGMTNSSFETPSGLDGENHYSTAYDMALLAREALKNPKFREICSQPSIKTSYGSPPYDRWLKNHNRLLTSYEGTIGIKTGFTKKAGRCLVSAVERDGVTLICVTLKCPNDWAAHKALYDSLAGKIKLEDLSVRLPQITVPVTGGVKENVSVLKCDEASIPVSTGINFDYRIRTAPFLYAPVKAGAFIGEADLYIDGLLVKTIDLAAGEDVALKHEYKERKSFAQKVRDLFKR